MDPLSKDNKVVRNIYVVSIGAAGLFGSYVRGEQKERSDIDILVSFSGIPHIFKYMELEEYLKKILRRRVDLVRKEAIRPALKNRILKETVYV